MTPGKRKQLTDRLAEVAEHYDLHSCWPQRSIDIVAEAGCWRWVIPKRWGGDGLGPPELLAGYEAVARGCVATALILTQRDGACELIALGENEDLKKRLLRAYARAERFVSVGIAQLTAPPGRRPVLRARRSGRHYLLDGVMPWVTGAEQCDEIVAGAVLPDGRQLLACVSCEDPGVVVEPPMDLMAVGASATSRVRCKAVRIGREDIIRGPTEAALGRRSPVKPLVVAAVGLGLAGALHDHLGRMRMDSELRALIQPLKRDYQRLRKAFFDTAARLPRRDRDGTSGSDLRVGVNTLVVRLGLAYLTACRGSGYCRPHPAERLLREAMLFLVWSAPPPVQRDTLATLLNGAAAARP